MRKNVLIILTLLVGSTVMTSTVWAESLHNYELGVVVGSQTGVSGAARLDANHSLAAMLSYSLDSLYGTAFSLDYRRDNARQWSLRQLSPLNFYYGIGVRLLGIRSGDDKDKVRLGLRAPFGVEHAVSNPDLQFFAELAPTVDVTPRTDVSLDVGIGVRYRF